MSGLSRGTRIALLASLALNVVFIVALLMLAPWKDGRDDERRGRHAPAFPALFDPRALRDALPADRHPVLNDALQAHRENMRARLGALFEARRAVRAAILAEPFQREVLDAAFVRLREAEAATANEAQAMLGDVLESTTVVERKTIAGLMARGGGRRGGERGRNDTPPQAPADPPPSPDQH